MTNSHTDFIQLAYMQKNTDILLVKVILKDLQDKTCVSYFSLMHITFFCIFNMYRRNNGRFINSQLQDRLGSWRRLTCNSNSWRRQSVKRWALFKISYTIYCPKQEIFMIIGQISWHLLWSTFTVDIMKCTGRNMENPGNCLQFWIAN